MHPQALAIVEERIASFVEALDPPAEDLAELIQSATEMSLLLDDDITVDTLREWRAAYQWWSTPQEWRAGAAAGLAAQVRELVELPGRRSWRRWWIVHRLARCGYALGLLAGFGVQFDWSGRWLSGWYPVGVRWPHNGRRRRPVYVLGWKVANWGCLLRRHHWPTRYKVAFDLCGRCAPCPDCRSTGPLEHDCPAATS